MGRLNVLQEYTEPMHRWMATAAAGISQRLKGACGPAIRSTASWPERKARRLPPEVMKSDEMCRILLNGVEIGFGLKFHSPRLLWARKAGKGPKFVSSIGLCWHMCSVIALPCRNWLASL